MRPSPIVDKYLPLTLLLLLGSVHYLLAVLGLALMWYIPLTISWLQREDEQMLQAKTPVIIKYAGLTSAALLYMAQVFPFAAYGLVLWVLACFYLSFLALRRFFQGELNTSDWILLSALLFVPIGGTNLLLYATNLPFFIFSGEIVRLTALHFHYAGFLLPISLYACRNHISPKRLKMGAFALWINIPLTALGITTTALNFSPYIETTAGVLMSVTGLYIALCLLQTGRKLKFWPFEGAALSLALAMIWAGLFAIRIISPISFLDWPFMWSIHGGLNAFGFAGMFVYGITQTQENQATSN